MKQCSLSESAIRGVREFVLDAGEKPPVGAEANAARNLRARAVGADDEARGAETLERKAAAFAREVGLPVARAVQAFGQGRYAASVALLRAVRGIAHRFGGSHAQRDMFSWTMTEAAVRLGDRALADSFVGERLFAKPESPVNKAWAMRAEKLKRKQAA